MTYRSRKPSFILGKYFSTLKIIHNGKNTRKSESTKHVLTQTDNSYRKYGTLHKDNRIEIKIVESFDKQYSFIIGIFSTRIGHDTCMFIPPLNRFPRDTAHNKGNGSELPIYLSFPNVLDMCALSYLISQYSYDVKPLMN